MQGFLVEIRNSYHKALSTLGSIGIDSAAVVDCWAVRAVMMKMTQRNLAEILVEAGKGWMADREDILVRFLEHWRLLA
jgi:hypothetical protein